MSAHASIPSCACTGVLFVIQGCGQQKLAKNWGDGLATDPAAIASMGLSDPNPFFAALLQKPYLSQARPARRRTCCHAAFSSFWNSSLEASWPDLVHASSPKLFPHRRTCDIPCCRRWWWGPTCTRHPSRAAMKTAQRCAG